MGSDSRYSLSSLVLASLNAGKAGSAMTFGGGQQTGESSSVIQD